MLKLISNDRFSTFLFLTLLFVASRILAFSWGYPISHHELTWLSIGEKLGNNVLAYHQLDTTLSPLSAFLYYLIDLIAGKSRLLHWILASIIIIIQALLFQNICSKNEMYLKKTFVPFFFYLLFSSFHQEFLFLSPELMGLTFFFLVWDQLFDTYEQATSEPRFFTIGFYIGVGILFYFPFFLLCIPLFICLFLFSKISIIEVIRLIYGLIFPSILLGAYYFYVDGFSSFWDHILFHYSFSETTVQFISITRNGIIFVIPIVLLALGLITLIPIPARINKIKKIQSSFLLFFLFASVTVFLDPVISFGRFYLLVPFFTLFSCYYFIKPKKVIVKDILFIGSTLLIFSFGFFFNNDYFTRKKWFDMKKIYVTQESDIKNKKVLVLSNDISYWNNNTLATRFTNWDISKKHFKNLDYYKNLAIIYEQFIQDTPEVIIDPEEIMEKVFNKIPRLKYLYDKRGHEYHLKEAVILD